MGVPIPFDNDGVQLSVLASCAMLLTDGIADGAAPQREPTAYPTPADAYVRITLPNDLLPAALQNSRIAGPNARTHKKCTISWFGLINNEKEERVQVRFQTLPLVTQWSHIK